MPGGRNDWHQIVMGAVTGRSLSAVFHLNEEGSVGMPAFTFEKLPPPADRAPPPVVIAKPQKHRGIIVQLLDRMTEAKLERSTRMIESGKDQRTK